MARLDITIDPLEEQEGQGRFVVRFSLVEEPSDPSGFTSRFAEFNYSVEGEGGNSSDLSGDLSGQIRVDYFTSGVINLTPKTDGLTEPNENFTVSAELVSPLIIATGLPPREIEVNTTVGSPAQGVIIDECFLAGTKILTIDGDRPVEELKIGDLVKTFDGKIEEIKWIGKQTRHRFTAHPTRSLPIQIKVGALGNGLPTKDLHVSPDHALLVEDLLINAGALVNDISIVKTYPEQYVYYHVELENHALLVAEGAPAESFFPNQEDRSLYDNGAEYKELYPHGSKLMLFPMDYPRVSSYNKVPRYVRQKLMQIAEELYEVKTA
ncbi:MAG: Hint domain-containing protein [Cyanobacteria bacterium P01_C01_bin.72]